MAIKIRNVTVIGAGLMGSGIAQVCADAGFNVVLMDFDEEILDFGRKRISASLQKMHKNLDDEKLKSLIDAIQQRIKTTTNLREAVRQADLVIEAIIENMDAKRNLFQKIEANIPKNSIIATNTSSLKLSDLSKNMRRKANFGGLHFFNPVPRMRLLEVITIDETSPNTLHRLLEFGKSIKKITVHCKDSPGFIANRILIPMQTEALGLVDRGVASPKDIDLACREGLGFAIGPFALLDFVGIDTANNIIKGWIEHYPDEIAIKSSPTLKSLVAAKKLGRKTGEGFYKYKSKL